jgi:hypothetical protein
MFAFKSTRQPYLDPAGPETLELNLDFDIVTSGSLVTLTADADDTRFDSNGWGDEPAQSILAARYSLDAPSWETDVTFPLEAVDGTFNASVESVQATIDTTGWTSGRHLLFVESQDADGIWGVPSAIFLTIQEATYSPGLQPLESSQLGNPGETLSHLITLTNMGTIPDSFDIQISGNTWDSVTSQNQIGPLDPGESQEFYVETTIPLDAAPGISDTATVTAVSQGDNTKTASALVITSTRLTFSFELSPITAEDSARSGETVTYLLTITNTGSAEDSYTFSLGTHNWETTILLPETPLPSGESDQLTITVTIPPASAPRSFELLEFTLISQGDPDQSVLATMLTRVDFPGFLPLIKR